MPVQVAVYLIGIPIVWFVSSIILYILKELDGFELADDMPPVINAILLGIVWPLIIPAVIIFYFFLLVHVVLKKFARYIAAQINTCKEKRARELKAKNFPNEDYK